MDAQVFTTDASWCNVMEQALSDRGISASVRCDMDGNRKIVHVTADGKNINYDVPETTARVDYSSPVCIIVDRLEPPYSTHGRQIGAHVWPSHVSTTTRPDDVYTNMDDIADLEAAIRTRVARIPRVALYDGEFAQNAINSESPLLVLKTSVITALHGDVWDKPKEGASMREPRKIQRRMAYSKIHCELTDYRTGRIVLSRDINHDYSTYSTTSDPMNDVIDYMSRNLQNAIASLYPSVAPRPSVSGKILNINEVKKDKAESVFINLGTDHEIQKGDTFTVYAETNVMGNIGATQIGTLSVTEVQGNTLSLCKVKKGEKEILTYMQNNHTLIIHSN